MRGLVLAGVLAVAGCAGLVQPPVPKEARLSETVLTVQLADGTVCWADWAAAGGAGRLESCGPGYDYRVTVVEKPNLLREFWSSLTQALGAEGGQLARVGDQFGGGGGEPPGVDGGRIHVCSLTE